MEVGFEIMSVWHHHNRGDFICARLTEENLDFHVMEGAVLGGVPVYHYIEMPRKLDENGEPRLDVFVFRPLSLERLPTNYFAEGQKVKLVSTD